MSSYLDYPEFNYSGAERARYQEHTRKGAYTSIKFLREEALGTQRYSRVRNAEERERDLRIAERMLIIGSHR